MDHHRRGVLLGVFHRLGDLEHHHSHHKDSRICRRSMVRDHRIEIQDCKEGMRIVRGDKWLRVVKERMTIVETMVLVVCLGA